MHVCTSAHTHTHTHTHLFYVTSFNETEKKYNLHIIQATDFKLNMGFPGVSDGKESACSAGDPGLTPGRGRFPWRREWLPKKKISEKYNLPKWTQIK